MKTSSQIFKEVLEQTGFANHKPSEMSNSDYWMCTQKAMDVYAEQFKIKQENTQELNIVDLSNIFKNINHKPCSTPGYDLTWDVTENEKYIGELFYSNEFKEWFFIKDNYPHQRKVYRISFPINNTSLMIDLFKSIGIELIKS